MISSASAQATQTQSKATLDGDEALRRFDFGLVDKRLVAVFLNVSRDLERRINQAAARRDADSDRCLTLLQVMVRFAWNSCKAVACLTADTPLEQDRKPNFVLVVPNINRQLLDLLFSLAYMRDDFSKRSLEYQRAGWRELVEEDQQFRTRFSLDEEWKLHFENTRQVHAKMVEQLGITPAQEKQPSLVPYWKTPLQLTHEKTQCREFLKYLAKWLYKDTSAQTHLSFGGLFPIAPFLLPNAVTDQADRFLEGRAIEMFRSKQISRTAVIFLAIATEIDSHSALGNRTALVFLWNIFAEHVAEAKEMLEIRYVNRSK